MGPISSRIRFELGGAPCELEMITQFPAEPDVKIALRSVSPSLARIHIRIPGWSNAPTVISVNGMVVAQGAAGTYTTLERTWAPSDTITFRLFAALRQTRYAGVDQVSGRNRYAFEYGPILLAALGAVDEEIELAGALQETAASTLMRPHPDRPLHFVLPKNVFGEGSEVHFVPYYEVTMESFSCFPLVRTRPSALET